MDSSLEKLKGLLKQEIGLDASTVGEATIHKILNQRMRSCQIKELDNYFDFLQGNKEELHALLETSVIPETWFFRDHRPFVNILDHIRKNLIDRPNKTCNILCIPCSTGEEPYSMSMYLLQHGIPEKMFNIQAVDISYQSLEIARDGSYGTNSFRGKIAKDYINKYFKLEEKQYQINSNVKSKVKFNRVNILDKSSIPFGEKFDFILCRNLLIYFDLPTKDIAFSNLNDLLTDDGTLFIGHSEFGSVPGSIFKTVKRGETFCLVKSNPEEEERTKQQQKKLKTSIKQNKTVKTPLKQKNIIEKKAFSNKRLIQAKKPEKKQTSTVTSTSTQDLLLEARKLADSGQFNDAETLCLKYIEEQGDHCETFFLLGLISEASGKSQQADSLYRKALYLNPKHYETLIHLSFIVEQQGDAVASKRLRERAERSIKH